MADWWMLSGTTSTASGANQPVMTGQTVVTQTEIASCGVGNEELALGSVTSEKASTALRTRSVVAYVDLNPAKGATWCSTGLLLWIAPMECVVSAIKVSAISAWQFTTCGEGFIVHSSALGNIGTYCTSSTGVLKTIGDVAVFQSMTGITLPACSRVYGDLSVAACSDAGIGLVQIDYLSAG